MSKESAAAYLEKLAADADFKKKIESAPDNEARLNMVKEAGYDFTKDELREVIQEKSGKKLSDAELEQVSGGAIVGAAVGAVGATVGTTAGTVVGQKARK